jgi:FkbM family methyltransferase
MSISMKSVSSGVKQYYWRLRKTILNSPQEPDRIETVTLGNQNYSVPGSQPTVLSFDSQHEPWLDSVYKLALESKSGAFIDVGVNRGQTLGKILAIDSGRRYIGFEPQSICVSFVDQFLSLNALNGTHHIVPIGLSDYDGVAELKYHSQGLTEGTASIAAEHRPAHFYLRSSYIPVFRGDRALQGLEIEQISCIKIDVEGAELEVLKGFVETIRSYSPYIVFEVLNNFLVATNEPLDEELTQYRNARAKEISEFLVAMNYCIYNVRDGEFVHTETIRPEVSSDLTVTDYIAIPAHRDVKT